MSTTETRVFRGTGDLSAFLASRIEPAWMRKFREAALKRFSALEWPTTHEEEWRRSDISNYDFDSYNYGLQAGAAVPTHAVDAIPAGYAGYARFENGQCVSLVLKPELAERGVRLVSLNELFSDLAAEEAGKKPAVGTVTVVAASPEAKALENLLRKSLENVDNRIQAWHYCSITHGVYFFVPSFVEVSEPVLVEYYGSGEEALLVPETVVILEKGARGQLVQRVAGDSDGALLWNEASDIQVKDAASLVCLSVEQINIDSSWFSNGSSWVNRDASLVHFAAVFGGMFAKNRVDCVLDGPGSDLRLNGIYFGHEDQHFDVRTVQHHNAPHAVSRTYYKGAVKDEAHAIYQGLIQVAHEATRTDAFLNDKNLILNDGARADSIPSLQINTDDVKCSHGSTTGRLDENQVFYLMVRGYSREEAEELLVEGFFGDLIDHAPEPAREQLRGVIMRRLLAQTSANGENE
ncbi:MAG TPA: Fe-S cluster assembly protein SufD [Spirochaetia bacterium]|nr:Fe-S cluster assembly protein SufD [Spirochaetia bacterium]